MYISRNTFKAIVLIILCITFTSPAFASDPPSKEVIQEWWSKHSTEKISFTKKKVRRVNLLNKEIAYLAQVWLFGRGRNDIDHVLLIRPTLQEVRVIGNPVTHDFEVYNLDKDKGYVSEVAVVSLGSGQGTTIGKKSIVQFDGWEPKILYQAEFSENLGACGIQISNRECYSKEIIWTFTNLDQQYDGNDLLEAIVINKGPQTTQMKTTIQISTYSFKDGHFKRTNAEVKSGNTFKSSEKKSSNTK